MQVILLEKVQNLGELGESVNVRPGYARNFLLPTGKAVLATPANMAAFEERRAELERHEAELLGAATARAESLAGLVVTIARKSAEEGKLFGSVGPQDIAEAVSAQGIEIERHEVRLPHDTLRQIGEYQVGVHLYVDVDAEITVHLVPEE